LFPALYAIIDASPTDSLKSILSFGEKLAGGGVRLLQLRAKRAPARQLFELSQALVGLIGGSRTLRELKIIVNDRPDIAAIAGAGGVHVGQEDLDVEAARKICASPLWVGVSTHNLEQVRAADHTSADYVALGPIFATATKENPEPVVGLDFLRAARKLTRKPLVAIGGITVQSAGDVYRAGADAVAVISDLRDAADPARRAGEYLQIARDAMQVRE
jgi:thiamine-phosphate pyrophosphorylase